MQIRAVVIALLITACGIPTAPSPDGAELREAADKIAAAEYYFFQWSAEYDLSSDTSGRDRLEVSGSGSVDASRRDVDAAFLYDISFLESAQQLFADQAISDVESFTRVVDGELFVRGWNAAFIDVSVTADYDAWYRVPTGGLPDPFSTGTSLPAEVIPVLVDLLDGAVRDGDIFTASVDREEIFDLGERFPGSLFDFQLRVGGGEFVVTGEISDGLLSKITLEGDDPGADVDRFIFSIKIDPVDDVAVEKPDGYLEAPGGS